ncbi:MAG: hypothetical protein CMQ61_01605 [Gammaproteobacteria bacterium]|nr:hypothetical protein [Gammaproteobacteria bacterium]
MGDNCNLAFDAKFAAPRASSTRAQSQVPALPTAAASLSTVSAAKCGLGRTIRWASATFDANAETRPIITCRVP